MTLFINYFLFLFLLRRLSFRFLSGTYLLNREASGAVFAAFAIVALFATGEGGIVVLLSDVYFVFICVKDVRAPMRVVNECTSELAVVEAHIFEAFLAVNVDGSAASPFGRSLTPLPKVEA